MIKLKLIPSFLSILVAASMLAGCNTVQGIGKDVSAGGQALQRASGKDSSTTKNTSTSANKSKANQTVSTNYTATSSTTKTSDVSPTQTNQSYNY